MEIVTLPMKAIAPNTGQVPGLPANPRSWTKGDVERIAKSLKDTPELFEARPLLVYPYGGQYVILGGNLRHAGAQRNHEKDVPCIVFPEDTPTDKLKEIVIKDNGSFGSWDYDALGNEWDYDALGNEWDYDALGNEWDDLPLPEWGVPAWDVQQEAEPQAQEDDFDEDKDHIEVRCKPGDIWELGEHRLMCGDSIDLEQVKTLMGGGSR